MRPYPAQAALFEISGDISGGATVRSSFSIVVDDATEMVHSAATLPAEEIIYNDWYSYDVVSASARFDGYRFDETGIEQQSAFTGTPQRDIYMTPGPVEPESQTFISCFGISEGFWISAWYLAGP